MRRRVRTGACPRCGEPFRDTCRSPHCEAIRTGRTCVICGDPVARPDHLQSVTCGKTACMDRRHVDTQNDRLGRTERIAIDRAVAAVKRRTRLLAVPVVGSTRTCRCGATFTVRSPVQIWCSAPCRTTHECRSRYQPHAPAEPDACNWCNCPLPPRRTNVGRGRVYCSSACCHKASKARSHARGGTSNL